MYCEQLRADREKLQAILDSQESFERAAGRGNQRPELNRDLTHERIEVIRRAIANIDRMLGEDWRP